jgi:aminopeptidase YwaD
MDKLIEKAETYLNHLCQSIPNRCVGSDGNRKATDFFAQTLRALGWTVETPVFDCIDWTHGPVSLTVDDQSFTAQVSPFSLAADVTAPLVTAASFAELTAVDCTQKLLLLHGEIAREPLMPKNFPFYNPEEHQQIIGLLESKQPAAIITATTQNSAMAGGMYPFPMLEDGDFDIPSVYMAAEEGAKLVQLAGENVRLHFSAERIPTSGMNVIGRKSGANEGKIIVFAHIDSKAGTPGALDNASGVVVLLLLAEILANENGRYTTEIIALNGEDYYSTPGQIQYLKDNQDKLDQIVLGINLDGAGYRDGKTAYSLYGCSVVLTEHIEQSMAAHPEMIAGEPWFQGDHAIFYQNQVSALAITSENIWELTTNITHTDKDVPALVDSRKLVRTAQALRDLIRSCPTA